ncbi:hypothetical protein SGPA1_12659 [Streptomyces misionensis JCM 4497]
MGQTALGGDLHDLRVADELHEGAAEVVVAAVGVLEDLRVALQGDLALGGRGPGVGLDDDVGGDLAGLHGVGDALAVEGVHQAAGVADEQQAAGVVGLAVEGHGQGGAADRAGHVLRRVAPVLGHGGAPGLEDLAPVQLLERGGGVEHAEADVGGAVAHAEDPAVAGQQPVLGAAPVPQFQPGLQVVVVVAGRGEVRAHRDAHRAVLAPVQAHREGQPGGVAVGGDDERRVEGGLALLLADLGGDTGDPAGALVHDRAGDVAALVQPRARLLGVAGQDLIEVVALADESVVRVGGEIGPVELEAGAAADDAQALVAQPARLLGDVDAHGDELLDGAGGEAVTAHLFAGELGLLQEQYVETGLREVVRGRGAGWPRAHDDHIGGVVGEGLGHGGISPSSKSACRRALDMGSLFSGIDHPAEGLPCEPISPRSAAACSHPRGRPRLAPPLRRPRGDGVPRRQARRAVGVRGTHRAPAAARRRTRLLPVDDPGRVRRGPRLHRRPALAAGLGPGGRHGDRLAARPGALGQGVRHRRRARDPPAGTGGGGAGGGGDGAAGQRALHRGDQASGHAPGGDLPAPHAGRGRPLLPAGPRLTHC